MYRLEYKAASGNTTFNESEAARARAAAAAVAVGVRVCARAHGRNMYARAEPEVKSI